MSENEKHLTEPVALLDDTTILANIAALKDAALQPSGALHPPTPVVSPQTLAAHHMAGVYHAEAQAAAQAAGQKYRFVRPLTEAADSLIDYLQDTRGRYKLGLREIDMMTRGFGPGELVYVIGYSHSGKTQVFLSSVIANRDKRVVLFTLDEPAELVLTKLVCMATRSNAERLEERIKANDAEAIDKVRRIAREEFKNLIVVDTPLNRQHMTDAIREAEDWWGEKVDAVGIDYLELFARAEGEDVEAGSQLLKGWVTGQDFPVIVVHQGSRGKSGGGQELRMDSGKYGGEQEAIVMIGVRRQRDNEDLDAYERRHHENTVSVSVLKNKRPPSKRGEHDYFMEPHCGLVLPISEMPSLAPQSGIDAVRQVQIGQGQRDIYGGEA